MLYMDASRCWTLFVWNFVLYIMQRRLPRSSVGAFASRTSSFHMQAPATSRPWVYYQFLQIFCNPQHTFLWCFLLFCWLFWTLHELSCFASWIAFLPFSFSLSEQENCTAAHNFLPGASILATLGLAACGIFLRVSRRPFILQPLAMAAMSGGPPLAGLLFIWVTTMFYVVPFFAVLLSLHTTGKWPWLVVRVFFPLCMCFRITDQSAGAEAPLGDNGQSQSSKVTFCEILWSICICATIICECAKFLAGYI